MTGRRIMLTLGAINAGLAITNIAVALFLTNSTLMRCLGFGVAAAGALAASWIVREAGRK